MGKARTPVHDYIRTLKMAAEAFGQRDAFDPGDVLTFKPAIDIRPIVYRGAPCVFVRYLRQEEMDHGPLKTALRHDCLVMTIDLDGDRVPALTASALLRHWEDGDAPALERHLANLEAMRAGLSGLESVVIPSVSQTMN